MTRHNATPPLPLFQPLPVILPARFDQALDIQIPARWIGLYWEPQLNQVCYTDGETVGAGNSYAWQLFCTHPQIQSLLAPYQLGNSEASAQHYLLFDRQNRRLYVGESALVDDYLRQPATLELLAQLDRPQNHTQTPWENYLLRSTDRRWLLALVGIPAIALGFRLLHEVSEFIFEFPEFWDD